MSPSVLVLPTYADFVKRNKQLVDSLRQSCVFPFFKRPLELPQLDEFYCIRLSEEMLSKGEDRYYQPQINQAMRMSRRTCSRCGLKLTPLTQAGPTSFQCVNPFCFWDDEEPTSTKVFELGPVRGVVRIRWNQTFVVDEQDEEFENVNRQHTRYTRRWVDRCVIELDRRYDTMTLSQVFRTVGMLCDMNGWEMR